MDTRNVSRIGASAPALEAGRSDDLAELYARVEQHCAAAPRASQLAPRVRCPYVQLDERDQRAAERAFRTACKIWDAQAAQLPPAAAGASKAGPNDETRVA